MGFWSMRAIYVWPGNAKGGGSTMPIATTSEKPSGEASVVTGEPTG